MAPVVLDFLIPTKIADIYDWLHYQEVRNMGGSGSCLIKEMANAAGWNVTVPEAYDMRYLYQLVNIVQK